MKKIISIFLFGTLILACKQEPQTDEALTAEIKQLSENVDSLLQEQEKKLEEGADELPTMDYFFSEIYVKRQKAETLLMKKTGSEKERKQFERKYQKVFVEYQNKMQTEIEQQGFASETVRLEMYKELEALSVKRIKEIEKMFQ